MPYRRCGRSGLKLPAVSLGLWYNFEHDQLGDGKRKILHRAFDFGVTHFDLANNYGTPPGSAESYFGQILATDFKAHRDELIVSSKAGYEMWDGPYGEWGSRKYLISSCDQSLKRLGLDYVDIFYSHRPDPDTPMEETMGALDQIVRSGKALYAGISTYSPKETREANRILTEMGTPCLIHQPRYNMLDRWVEDGLLETLEELGIGAIAFSPLCQGILTDKYLHGIPQDSRQAKVGTLCWEDSVTASRIAKVQQLQQIAQKRGQSMSQLAITWVLRNKTVTSALFGASKVSHVEDAVASLQQADLSAEECLQIDDILNAE